MQMLFPRYPGRRAEDVHAVKAWHPAARVAVVVMLGILGGINIWLDAKLELRSLPSVQVIMTPVNLGSAAPVFRIG